MPDLFTQSNAILSKCERYRYALTRQWAEGRGCVFVMLNPSTADAMLDDPTIRRCIHFAKREGCAKLTVVNLFAWRATDPDHLFKRSADEAIGPENTAYLRAMTSNRNDLVIAAWGANQRAADRADAVLSEDLKNATLYCLGKSKSGAPRHPLYLKNEAPLTLYREGVIAP